MKYNINILIGTMRAKVPRERNEHLEQLEKERCQKKKKLIWDKLCIQLFGHKHSHHSKSINYFYVEEKNSMDIKQNQDGDKSRAIYEEENKMTYPDVSQHFKRKKKNGGKKMLGL